MGRPNQSAQRRGELIAAVAATFAELGYRRTTTAELATRCGVQETVLYRLWPDKRAMFTAAIEFVRAHSQTVWERALARRSGPASAAEAVLDHEADHLGEFGLYRILFAGLSETDDPEIAAALRGAYASFHDFIAARVREHRGGDSGGGAPHPDLTAWALIGLGTAANLGRELDLLPTALRRRLLADVGRWLLGGTA